MVLFVRRHGIAGRMFWLIRFDVQTCSKLAISQVCAQPFRTKWWSSVKNRELSWGERNPFAWFLEVGSYVFVMVVCVCFFAVCLCRSLKFCVYLCLLLLRIWHSISISFLLIIWIIFNEAFTYNVFGTTYKRVTCSSTLSGHPSSSSSINVDKSVGACRICFLSFWGCWKWDIHGYTSTKPTQPKSHSSSLTSRDWRQATARAPPRYTRSAYRGNVAPLGSPA